MWFSASRAFCLSTPKNQIITLKSYIMWIILEKRQVYKKFMLLLFLTISLSMYLSRLDYCILYSGYIVHIISHRYLSCFYKKKQKIWEIFSLPILNSNKIQSCRKYIRKKNPDLSVNRDHNHWRRQLDAPMGPERSFTTFYRTLLSLFLTLGLAVTKALSKLCLIFLLSASILFWNDCSSFQCR